MQKFERIVDSGGFFQSFFKICVRDSTFAGQIENGKPDSRQKCLQQRKHRIGIIGEVQKQLLVQKPGTRTGRRHFERVC